jgi:hypothetical protein
MLGRQQLDDLKADLLGAQAAGVTWKFVAVPEPIQYLGPAFAADRFEGYAAERTELLQFIDEQQIDNVVFLAADIHGTVVNDLSYRLTPAGVDVPLRSFEVTTGAVAYDELFGPVTMAGLHDLGAVNDADYALYLSLPPAQQDLFFEQRLNAVVGLLPLLGYYNVSPLGLDGSLIDADLLAGRYAAAHTYGWTEFEIDAVTQQLTVTTYGIEPYLASDLALDPAGVLARQPIVMSQFVVRPVPEPGTAVLAGILLGAGAVLSCRRRGPLAKAGRRGGE